MKCTNCGQELPEGTKICIYCGAPVEDIDNPGGREGSKKTKTILIALISVAALIGLIFIGKNLFGNDHSSGNSGSGGHNTEEDASSAVTGELKAEESESASQENTSGSEPKETVPEPASQATTSSTEYASADESATTSGKKENEEETIRKTVEIDANIPLKAVTFEGHSYWIFDNGCETWNDAQKFCESRGGYLAVINSPEENDFLYEYMLDAGYDEVFFGFTDQDNEGEWVWVSGKSSDYTDWGINAENSVEPNSSNDHEDYAHMNSSMHDGHWNDKMYGQKTTCYFCEWDLVSYLGKAQSAKAVRDGVPLKNDALAKADTVLELDKDEEVTVLYCLTKDDGEVWYYVQHRTGIIGYVEDQNLMLNGSEKPANPDTQAADTQAADTQAADTQAADTQAADTQAADTQAADAQTEDTQTEDVQVIDTQAAEDQHSPFYGIWCAAFKEEDGAVRTVSDMEKYGLPAEIFISSDWSNLNSERWYVITAGKYDTREEAEQALPGVQNYYENAFIKYTGEWIK